VAEQIIQRTGLRICGEPGILEGIRRRTGGVEPPEGSVPSYFMSSF
jgi:hypothetical protein